MPGPGHSGGGSLPNIAGVAGRWGADRTESKVEPASLDVVERTCEQEWSVTCEN